MNRRHWFGVAATLAGALRLDRLLAEADAKLWQGTVDKAINYLKSTQNPKDGSWSEQRSPGVTGVVVTGLLHTGRVTPNDPIVANGLKYIESLVNAKAGHIAGKDPKPQLQNYVTSINVMALVGRQPGRQVQGGHRRRGQVPQEAAVGRGRRARGQENDFYGGAGYDSKSRPDLSNTQFFLDALKAAGVAKDDPAFKKAAGLRQPLPEPQGRVQRPALGRQDQRRQLHLHRRRRRRDQGPMTTADGGLPGYGSMTYAGIKSLIYCGVSKDDPRIKKAFEWIQKNYTLDANPGMPKVSGQQGLYYYYHTMAKCLDVLGVDEFEDAEGKKHDWRAEITAALAKRQQPDGSLVNDVRPLDGRRPEPGHRLCADDAGALQAEEMTATQRRGDAETRRQESPAGALLMSPRRRVAAAPRLPGLGNSPFRGIIKKSGAPRSSPNPRPRHGRPPDAGGGDRRISSGTGRMDGGQGTACRDW